MGNSVVTNRNIMQNLDLEGVVRHVTLATGSATYSMKVSDQNLSVVSSVADASGIVTLPSLAESAGLFYYIVAPTGATAGDISLYEKETGSEYSGGDMDADDDHLILYSTGEKWRTVLNGVA